MARYLVQSHHQCHPEPACAGQARLFARSTSTLASCHLLSRHAPLLTNLSSRGAERRGLSLSPSSPKLKTYNCKLTTPAHRHSPTKNSYPPVGDSAISPISFRCTLTTSVNHSGTYGTSSVLLFPMHRFPWASLRPLRLCGHLPTPGKSSPTPRPSSPLSPTANSPFAGSTFHTPAAQTHTPLSRPPESPAATAASLQSVPTPLPVAP